MKYIFLILLMTVATSAHARGSRRIQPIEHPNCRLFLINNFFNKIRHFDQANVRQLGERGYRPQLVEINTFAGNVLAAINEQNELQVADIIVRGEDYRSGVATPNAPYPDQLTLTYYFVTSTSPLKISLIVKDDLTGFGLADLTQKGLKAFWPCKIR